MHIQSYLMKYTYNGFCADSGNREMTSRRASTGVLYTRPPANALLDPEQVGGLRCFTFACDCYPSLARILSY